MISILIDEQRYYNLLEEKKDLSMRIDELKEENAFLKQENEEYEEILNEWECVRKEIVATCKKKEILGEKPSELEMVLQKIEDI